MSKTPHTTKNEPTTTKSNEVVAPPTAPVAETVEQLKTVTQEKPAEEVKPLPAYDAEAIKKMNVSQSVRYLHNLGFTRGQIVKEFPKAKGRTILYQHVRNVLITPVKVSS